MTHISNEIILLGIQSMDQKFDTHKLIFWIMENYPRDYINELHDNFINNKSPYQQLHATIGRLLLQISSIQQQGQITSINLIGKMSSNELWQKL